MLKINKLSKKFNQKIVLNDISLSVEGGQVAVLVGASGVGKSTLLRILNNLETADAGTITLDGKPLDLSQVNKNHTVGMVFQQFNLFDHLTAEQNITLPLEKTTNISPDQAKKIAHELLAKYDLADKKDTYPHQLSGGQKQRLSITRTTALKPRIICFDEPTSALDPLLTSHVARNIEQLAKEGYIVIVATHDTTLLERLDCTIHLMRGGSIIDSVTSKMFYENRSAYPRVDQFLTGIIETIEQQVP
jgi:ABC-type polar amino acid transport system ATPase subunit